MFRWLDKDCTIAGPGYNRWLVPPAALAIHLSIGMAYGFSVFWLPLSHARGIAAHTPDDWKISSLGWIFTLFFVVLGSSAALFGTWLEKNGPRKAGVVAALCWGGGFFVSALGVYWRRIELLWLGSGIIGGCGLGLGYISPVSTLIKWFPDRRGMATGMAIMGFGGGAMVGAPLADKLMAHFATPDSAGVWQTFVVLGAVYLVAMLCGAFAYRLPPPGWSPPGWTAPAATASKFITAGHVHVRNAHKTGQFWLLWAVLCLNVSAGIGVIGMASPMLQEVFGGRLIGLDLPFTALDGDQTARVASIGAAFAGILSLFNIAGRIFWSSLSDHIGRKGTYTVFFVLGLLLYAAAAAAAVSGELLLFVGLFCVILSMYGGGFATIPAYLADLFGTQYVGAIHGRLLTAWSTAGILGPVLVNYIREFQIERGVPLHAAYNVTLCVLAALLFLGFLCNLFIRPVDRRHFMSEDELEQEWQVPTRAVQPAPPAGGFRASAAAGWWKVALAWLLVLLPLAWGLLKTIEIAAEFFR